MPAAFVSDHPVERSAALSRCERYGWWLRWWFGGRSGPRGPGPPGRSAADVPQSDAERATAAHPVCAGGVCGWRSSRIKADTGLVILARGHMIAHGAALDATLKQVAPSATVVPHDGVRQPLKSDPGRPRWKNTAQWARNKMVNDDLLRSNSPRGVWELTENGREYMKANSDRD